MSLKLKFTIRSGIILLTVCLFTPFQPIYSLPESGTVQETSVQEALPEKQAMVTRPMGKTGLQIPLFSLGGASIGRLSSNEKNVEIINYAIDKGVKYIDTAPRYVNGRSEIFIGRVMKTRRNEVFLATKSHDFSYDGTMRLAAQSLRRLQTDHIDLYQHHGVFYDYQLDAVMSENGALKAFKELKEAKKVRYIGITSHSPRILLKALELDVYDCMQIIVNPLRRNLIDRQYFDEFMKKAQEKGIGVIAMSIAGGGTLLKGNVKMQELMNYAWSYPVTTAVIGITETWQIDENVKAAADFKQLSEEEKRSLEKRFP
ncbi:MAG TPA: aldo/keto reductase [bacterium]|nr:aldo/keto reductase [bacterium]